MTRIKLYKITCTEGIYADDTQGSHYSLEPWGSDTLTIKGYDDGGQDYRLPDGYTVRETINGQHAIYNAAGEHCALITIGNTPAISDLRQDNYISCLPLRTTI